MEKSRLLFEELDKCIYQHSFEYNGSLEEYTYNGITYAQSSVTYYTQLLGMYREFLNEWVRLSEEERMVVCTLFDEIKNKRYIDRSFFFDVPTIETIQSMVDDGAPRKDVEMARFANDMSQQQCYFLNKVTKFLETPSDFSQEIDTSINNHNCYHDPLYVSESDQQDKTSKDTTLYQRLHELYGETITANQLSDFYQVGKRTIANWESRGYIENISSTNDELKSDGKKKRGEEKRYLTSQVAQNIEMQIKFNKLR